MRRQILSAWLVAALGAAVYVLVAPFSADLAAQEYRADLGLTLWNNGWYAGHHTPGYSLLFPPLGHVLGARLTGALAAVAAAVLFTPLARRAWGERNGTPAALWFAAGTTALLLNGRLTFLLGVAIGVGALLALSHGRGATALVLAVLTTLASPVAGLFVALAVAAWALADRERQRWRWGIPIAAAAMAPGAVALLLFPEGGTHPFALSSFWPALAGTLVLAALLPSDQRALRIGALLYAVALVATFAISTPLGGNVTRLGAVAAGPVLLGALAGRRHLVLVVLLALAFAYWPVYPAIRDVVRATGDLSVHARYHAPLVEFLRSRGAGPEGAAAFRVEIPMTTNHWEARHVAPAIPLARGWERQLDRRDGALFYDGSLDAATYRAWLDEHAVAHVAIPDVVLDRAGADEARLVMAGLPYLRPVWRDAHWRVFAVARPVPLAGSGARATLSPAGVTLRATGPGEVRLRVHPTRWWRVVAGRACVSEGPDETTLVRVAEPGTVRLQARLTGSSCRG